MDSDPQQYNPDEPVSDLRKDKQAVPLRLVQFSDKQFDKLLADCEGIDDWLKRSQPSPKDMDPDI